VDLCLYLQHFTNTLTFYIPEQENKVLAVLTLYLWYENIMYCISIFTMYAHKKNNVFTIQ